MNNQKVKAMLRSIGMICLVSLLVPGSNKSVKAQNSEVQTHIIIETGVSEELAETLESKSGVLLNAINVWNESGEDIFPEDSGSESLKLLAEELSLVSRYDTLRTFAMKAGNNYEIPKIFLQNDEGGQFQFTELTLLFSEDAELLNARVSPQIRNIDRILTRNIEADEEEHEQAVSFLDSYQQMFIAKDRSSIRRLFDEEALIVVGSRMSNGSGFEYTRYTADEYLTRLENYTFTEGNEIGIEFDSVKVLRHPDNDNVYGISLYQHWNTSQYSDEGYMFFIVDMSSQEPYLLARSWRQSPFRSGEFTQIQPDPKDIAVRLTEVNNKNESGQDLSHSLELNEGILVFNLPVEDQDLLNIEVLEKWISDRTLDFKGIKVDPSAIELSNEQILELSFTSEWQQGQQEVQGRMVLRETSLLRGFDTPMSFYLQRRNKLDLIISDSLPPAKDIDLYADLELSSNTRGTDVSVNTVAGQTLINENQEDSVFNYSLLEGDYDFVFKKDGFFTQDLSLQVERAGRYEQNLMMESIPEVVPVIPVVETKKSFFSKNKYWIIGGAAALLTSSVMIMSNGNGGGGDTGIPIPPGRPGA